MSDFKSVLVVRMLPEMDDQSWQLVEPLVYFSDRLGDHVTVPAGFITNFVSFEALKNVGQRAAVVHDYLYSCGDFARELADDILHEALNAVGVNGLLADSMWIAVRLCGAGAKTSDYLYFADQKTKGETK